MTNIKIEYIHEFARKLRNNSLKMAFDAGKNGAHLGGGLSAVEIFACLYGGIMNVNSKHYDDANRDRLIISKGHCVLPYYSALRETGFLTNDDISGFEVNGSPLHGHATRDITKGMEFSGGSLGLGMSYAVGVALSAKLDALPYHVYVIVGDGECNEGIVWEALMSASHYGLNNLTVIVDHNKLQYDGSVSTVMNMGDLKVKFDAFGCQTIEVDGHNVEELCDAFNRKSETKPNAIIAHTVKGKGVSFMENKKEWHHGVLSKDQFDIAMSEQLSF